jgi:hypothetical protein
MRTRGTPQQLRRNRSSRRLAWLLDSLQLAPVRNQGSSALIEVGGPAAHAV